MDLLPVFSYTLLIVLLASALYSSLETIERCFPISSMVHITELEEEENMMMDEYDMDDLDYQEDMDIDMDATKGTRSPAV